MSRDDLTTSKLVPDSETSTADPTKDVEDTNKAVVNVVEYVLPVKMIIVTLRHGKHTKNVRPRDDTWSWSRERMRIF